MHMDLMQICRLNLPKDWLNEKLLKNRDKIRKR
jgi:hypothetical protein